MTFMTRPTPAMGLYSILFHTNNLVSQRSLSTGARPACPLMSMPSGFIQVSQQPMIDTIMVNFAAGRLQAARRLIGPVEDSLIRRQREALSCPILHCRHDDAFPDAMHFQAEGHSGAV